MSTTAWSPCLRVPAFVRGMTPIATGSSPYTTALRTAGSMRTAPPCANEWITSADDLPAAVALFTALGRACRSRVRGSIASWCSGEHGVDGDAFDLLSSCEWSQQVGGPGGGGAAAPRTSRCCRGGPFSTCGHAVMPSCRRILLRAIHRSSYDAMPSRIEIPAPVSISRTKRKPDWVKSATYSCCVRCLPPRRVSM